MYMYKEMKLARRKAQEVECSGKKRQLLEVLVKY